MRTKSVALIVALAALLVIVACAPVAAPAPAPAQPTSAPAQATSAPAQATSAPAQATSAPAQATSAPAQPTTASAQPTTATSGGTRIAYIPQNTGNPYFERINFGFQEACKTLGCTVTFTAPATADTTAQIPFVQEQVQRGIDVLAIQANSVDALNQTFDEVRAKGIPIIATNADITGNETHRDAAVLAIDFDKVGAAQVELMGRLMNYEGKFAILSATPDAPAQKHFVEDPGGMKDVLKNDPKYSKMELVEVAYGNDVPEKSLTECEALLTKYPDLKGILAPTTVAVAAAAQCVESAGVYPGGPNAKNGGVIVTGLGTPNQMRRFVKDGIVVAFQLWDPANIGIVAAYLADGIKKGAIKPAEGATFDVPPFGTLKFGKNNVVIVGPMQDFDKNNIDQFQF